MGDIDERGVRSRMAGIGTGSVMFTAAGGGGRGVLERSSEKDLKCMVEDVAIILYADVTRKEA